MLLLVILLMILCVAMITGKIRSKIMIMSRNGGYGG